MAHSSFEPVSIECRPLPHFTTTDIHARLITGTLALESRPPTRLHVRGTTTMNSTDTPRNAIESRDGAVARIEASSDGLDRPQYVDSVLHELRQVVGRARCPVHRCGPALTVDFHSTNQGGLKVIARNCCPMLDEVVARALRVYPLFRLETQR